MLTIYDLLHEYQAETADLLQALRRRHLEGMSLEGLRTYLREYESLRALPPVTQEMGEEELVYFVDCNEQNIPRFHRMTAVGREPVIGSLEGMEEEAYEYYQTYRIVMEFVSSAPDTLPRIYYIDNDGDRIWLGPRRTLRTRIPGRVPGRIRFSGNQKGERLTPLP